MIEEAAEKYKSKINNLSSLHDTYFFFPPTPAEDEAEATRITTKNVLQVKLTHTTFVTLSPTRNSQTNLMLLTSPSCKVLSTIPSSGSMPRSKKEYEEKQKELEAIAK